MSIDLEDLIPKADQASKEVGGKAVAQAGDEDTYSERLVGNKFVGRM